MSASTKGDLNAALAKLRSHLAGHEPISSIEVDPCQTRDRLPQARALPRVHAREQLRRDGAAMTMSYASSRSSNAPAAGELAPRR